MKIHIGDPGTLRTLCNVAVARRWWVAGKTEFRFGLFARHVTPARPANCGACLALNHPAPEEVVLQALDAHCLQPRASALTT